MPIFLSNSTNLKFLVGGTAPQTDFGLFQSNFSYVMYHKCETPTEFQNLEEFIAQLISCSSYNPEFCFNPLTLMCFIINPMTGQKKKIRLAYDNCSNVTILEEEICDKLALEGSNCDVAFHGTGGTSKAFGGQRAVKFKYFYKHFFSLSNFV